MLSAIIMVTEFIALILVAIWVTALRDRNKSLEHDNNALSQGNKNWKQAYDSKCHEVTLLNRQINQLRQQNTLNTMDGQNNDLKERSPCSSRKKKGSFNNKDDGSDNSPYLDLE